MNDAHPYAPPTTPIPFGEVNILSAQGRLGRVRYIGYSIGIGIIINVIIAIVGGLATLVEGGSEAINGLISGLIIIMAIAGLAVAILVAIQRLHDIDASGWWSLLVIVPLVNLIFYLALMIAPGTQGANRFGNPPPPNTIGVILLALIIPLVAIIGIIAAIAIPAYQNYAERAREVAPNSVPAQ